VVVVGAVVTVVVLVGAVVVVLVVVVADVVLVAGAPIPMAVTPAPAGGVQLSGIGPMTPPAALGSTPLKSPTTPPAVVVWSVMLDCPGVVPVALPRLTEGCALNGTTSGADSLTGTGPKVNAGEARFTSDSVELDTSALRAVSSPDIDVTPRLNSAWAKLAGYVRVGATLARPSGSPGLTWIGAVPVSSTPTPYVPRTPVSSSHERVVFASNAWDPAGTVVVVVLVGVVVVVLLGVVVVVVVVGEIAVVVVVVVVVVLVVVVVADVVLVAGAPIPMAVTPAPPGGVQLSGIGPTVPELGPTPLKSPAMPPAAVSRVTLDCPGIVPVALPRLTAG